MTSTTRTYFQDVYSRDDDPWQLASSEYEQRKYSITMASLPRSRYRSAFEPGCSVGVLTALLAERCDQLLAVDIVDVALAQTARRVKEHSHVRVERRAIPWEWPMDMFDLVILSEVAYYFDENGLADIMKWIDLTTSPGAHVVGVHWRGETNYPLTGDRVHELITSTKRLVPVVHHAEPEFVLDVWERDE